MFMRPGSGQAILDISSKDTSSITNSVAVSIDHKFVTDRDDPMGYSGLDMCSYRELSVPPPMYLVDLILEVKCIHHLRDNYGYSETFPVLAQVGYRCMHKFQPHWQFRNKAGSSTRFPSSRIVVVSL